MSAHTLFPAAASLFSAETQDVTATTPGSGSRSQNAAGPTRNVVDVHQPADKWKTKYQFPTQALPSLPDNRRCTEAVISTITTVLEDLN